MRIFTLNELIRLAVVQLMWLLKGADISVNPFKMALYWRP